MSAGEGDCHTDGEDSDYEHQEVQESEDRIRDLTLGQGTGFANDDCREDSGEETSDDNDPSHQTVCHRELPSSADVGDYKNQTECDRDSTESSDDDNGGGSGLIGQFRRSAGKIPTDNADDQSDSQPYMMDIRKEPTYIFSVRENSADESGTRFELVDHNQSASSAYGTSPTGASFIHYELSSMSEIEELKQELKKFNRRGCFNFSTCFSLLALVALAIVFSHNFAEQLPINKYEGKLSSLREEFEGQKKQQEMEEDEADQIISKLKARIEEERATNERLKIQMQELRDKIKEEEQNFQPAPEGLEQQLKEQEENLLAEVVTLREKLKFVEDDSYRADRMLSEIMSIKKSILDQERELHQAILQTEENIERKCKRVREEMEVKMAKLLADLKELTKQEIPVLLRDKYEESLIKRMIIDKVSKAAIELLDETLKIQEKEKETRVELDVLQEMESMITSQAEKKQEELMRKIDEKLKDNNLQKFESSEKSTMKNTEESQSRFDHAPSSEVSQNDHQEADISLFAEEQSKE